MAYEIAAAGIAAAGSVASGAIASGRGHKSQRRALRYNKELAQYQNDLALQNWERQNEYNSPQSQMQRYRDAGLNPNLIYSQGSSGNSDAIGTPSVAPYQESDTQSNDLGVGEAVNRGLSSWLQLKRQQSDLATAEYQRTVMQTQNLKDLVATLDNIRSYKRQSYEDKEVYRLGMSQAAVMLKNMQYTESQISKTNQERLNLQQEYDLTRQLGPYRVDILKYQLKQLKDQTSFNFWWHKTAKDLKIVPGSKDYDRVLQVVDDWLSDRPNLLSRFGDKVTNFFKRSLTPYTGKHTNKFVNFLKYGPFGLLKD